MRRSENIGKSHGPLRREHKRDSWSNLGREFPKRALWGLVVFFVLAGPVILCPGGTAARSRGAGARGINSGV